MKCSKCGNQIEENAKFCKNCGNEVVTKKSNNNIIKILVIIASVVLLFILGFLVFNLIKNHTGNNPEVINKEIDNNPPSEYIKNDIDVSKLKIKADDERSKKIEVVKTIYNKRDHSLVVLLKNNNSEPVSFDCFLNYYDSNNKRVDRTSEYGYINPGKYYVGIINNMTKEKYSSTGIEIQANKVKSYMHVVDIDNSSLNIMKEDDSIKVSYTNPYDSDLSIYYGVLYYKNDKLVFFDHYIATTIKKDNAGVGSFSIYKFPNYSYDKKASDLYDRYEIFVSAATYKDSTY